ncbi:hypothetical protein COHA_004456 [Chlorella ohadii]|uniref:Protein kinase domain-containing protein n=1 Tax=Chlorella ohadii TaxID=2649997 RepID=A0AAD5DT47_9CHLO|nr:hypothetical protein COHA_004456 [Chlorella ohadii]
MSSLTQVVPLAGVEASAATFMHEARMLHGLRHRCVVQLAGVALHGDKALLIMEFMEGRDLFSALNLRDKSGERVFSWYKRGKRVALDVASALAFLHARKVMHFDVKAGNVMLTRDFTAKLGDVGLSKAMTHTFASKQGGVGTFAWCAPEVLQGKPCTYSADIYSYGVLLYEIVTGEVPLRGRLAVPRAPEQCPQAVVDLMLRCMSEDAAQRPTANQLVEELATLTGQKLAGGNGLVSGEDGLDRTISGHAGSIWDGQPASPMSPVHATRLAGVDAGPPRTMPPSPFA